MGWFRSFFRPSSRYPLSENLTRRLQYEGHDGVEELPVANWLQNRVSLEELGDDWGLLQAEWNALRARSVPGDEWWEFSSAQGQWNQLAGRAGYALLRRGEVIGYIVTLES